MSGNCLCCLTILWILISPYAATSQTWLQKGIDVHGTGDTDYLGRSVTISDDGLTLAVGTNGIGNYGDVQVYEWDSVQWVPKGGFLNGGSQADGFGHSIELNSNGTVLIVGAPWNDDVAGQAGKIQVFEWNGSDWVQKGQDIYGLAYWDETGEKVDISGDGNIIAIGTMSGTQGWTIGKVQIFEWDGMFWEPKGDDIIGEDWWDHAGVVQISKDGMTVVIGGPGNDDNGAESGHVRVYEWIDSLWIQKGVDLEGSDMHDGFGTDVSINSDGSIIAVEADNGGYIRVFKWQGSMWVQQGSDIVRQVFAHNYGNSLDMSGNGLVVATGCDCYYSSLASGGTVHIYEWNGTGWDLKGDFISGAEIGDAASAPALSYDGNIVAIGARMHDVIDMNTNGGELKVYEFDTICAPEGIPSVNVISNDEILGGDGWIDISVFGGTNDYSYQWFGPGGYFSDLEDIDSLDEGLYTLVIIDRNNCKVNVEVEILPNSSGFELEQINSVQVFPNPTSGLIKIEIDQGEFKYARIIDMQGRTIENQLIESNDFSFDLSSCDSGVYFLLLENEEQVFQFKIQKN